MSLTTCYDSPNGLSLRPLAVKVALGKNLVTSAFAKSKSDADLVAFIKVGRPASDPANTTHVDMPPKGGNPALTDAQLGDIVAYVRTLEK